MSEEKDMKSEVQEQDVTVEEPCAEDATPEQEDLIEQLQQEKEALDQKYLRLSADFQNYKKRVENEKKDIYAYANEKIVIDLLDVKDNFERALVTKENEQGKEEGLMEGVRMICTQLNNVLEKYGVKEIEALNQPFDPNYHHAVLKCPQEGVESDIVIDVMQKGYTLNTKVIRASMVKVSE